MTALWLFAIACVASSGSPSPSLSPPAASKLAFSTIPSRSPWPPRACTSISAALVGKSAASAFRSSARLIRAGAAVRVGETGKAVSGRGDSRGLRSLLTEWTKVALPLVRDHRVTREVYHYDLFAQDPEDRGKLRLIHFVDGGATVLAGTDAIQALPETRDLLGLLASDTELVAAARIVENRHPLNAPLSPTGAVYWVILHPLLAFWVELEDTEPEQSHPIFDELEQALYDKQAIPVRFVTHFANLAAPDRPIELAPNVTLGAFSLDDQIEMVRSFHFDLKSRPDHGDENEFKVGGKVGSYALLDVRLPFGEAESNPPTVEHTRAWITPRAVLLILRLLSSEPVGIRFTKQTTESHFVDVGRASERRPNHQVDVLHERYAISDEIAAELRRLLPITLVALKNPILRVPLGRFEDAHTRLRPSERLIDCWIALESLFMAPGKHAGKQATINN
jgi:hypothetical protein